MSLTTMVRSEHEHAERWRQWQLGNAKSRRRAATRACIVLALVLTAAFAWPGLQIAYLLRST